MGTFGFVRKRTVKEERERQRGNYEDALRLQEDEAKWRLSGQMRKANE